ncbi:lipase maturation factor 2-like isoform X1 [Centruroides sculpturatus]|uniref:lipase maturation factor 2-like isoform X1 n=1 Tax=Centruroides sculpturatus TaxID=218467 RepID=UPI000C6E7305|nr:lipase maturation factor 2-like isoform X1 [Centruroides sculpturatus]
MMEFLTLLGIIISFGGVVWNRLRDCTNYALLWMIYFSVFQVGQTFMWFQWDILLLEAGFLTILLAPLGIFHQQYSISFLSSLSNKPYDTVNLWLLRWLLFRLMFASGVVKLLSNCPTWWNLTALTIHFESQCIPTSLAWFAHYLPTWLLKLAVVGTFVIEIAIPFLFFIPIHSLRVFSFHAQMLFQVSIILTGNYNFFNLLTMALCLSLVDDDFLLHAVQGRSNIVKGVSGTAFRWMRYFFTQVIEILIYGGLIYWTIQFFNLRILSDWTIESKIAFSKREFLVFIKKILPVTIWIGVLSLSANILIALYSGVAVWMFSISLIPHTIIDRSSQQNLWPVVRTWHSRVDKFNLVNSYGLFRRMTGVGGRPELVVEGSNSLHSGWNEYHFLYKPGNLTCKPAFIIPHQPRLDWQMWFAALGSYSENPWFVSLVYRLLHHQQEVLDLMDKELLPFQKQPPRYIRATLYKYKYTDFTVIREKKNGNWWKRDSGTEYFPPLSKDDRSLINFIKAKDIPVEKSLTIRVTNLFVKRILTTTRKLASMFHPTTFIWSLFCSGITIKMIYPILQLL